MAELAFVSLNFSEVLVKAFETAKSSKRARGVVDRPAPMLEFSRETHETKDPLTDISGRSAQETGRRPPNRRDQTAAARHSPQTLEARRLFRHLVPPHSAERWIAPSSAGAGFRRSRRPTKFFRGVRARAEKATRKTCRDITRRAFTTDTSRPGVLLHKRATLPPVCVADSYRTRSSRLNQHTN
jgi:hypothetical protein